MPKNSVEEPRIRSGNDTVFGTEAYPSVLIVSQRIFRPQNACVWKHIGRRATITRHKGFTFLVLMAILAALLSFPASRAHAVVRTVTDPGDDLADWPSKTGMLRTVIYDCRDGDEIRFADTARTVYLRADVCFSPGKTVTLTGPATIATAQNNSGTRYFVVPKGATVVMKSLVLSGASPASGGGAAVRNEGALTMEGCTIKDGQCWSNGGAIDAGEGSVTTLTNCIVSGNKLLRLGYSGGGICVYKGTLTMTGCSVTNNTGAYYGGGVCFSGTATLTNCIIESNATDSNGIGGGVDGSGTLTMSGGAVRNNSSGYLGGGLRLTGETATLASVTIESNSASLPEGKGGGLYNGGAQLALVGCTVRNNSCGNRGGGIGTAGSLSLKKKCVITGNTPDNISAPSGYTSDGTNQIGTSPNKSATAFSGYSGESEPEPRSITGDADVAQVKNALTDPASDVFRAVSGALSQDLSGISGDASASLAGMTASLYYANTFEGVTIESRDLVVEYTASYPERARYYALFARSDGSGYEFPDRGVQFELEPGQTLPDGVEPPDFYEEGEGLMTWRNVVTDNGSFDLEPAAGIVTFRVCSVRAAEKAVSSGGSGCSAVGASPFALLLGLPLLLWRGTPSP